MLIAGLATAILSLFGLSSLLSTSKNGNESPGLIKSFLIFAYSCFLKPHQGDSKGNQQEALESFYKKQAGAYDATRKVLLRGREDMLNLVAAQLQSSTQNVTTGNNNKKIWVDVSLGHFTITTILTWNRLVAVPASISRPCLPLSMSLNSSKASTSLTSHPLFVRLRKSDLSALAGKMSRLFAKTLANSDLRITSLECLLLPGRQR